MIRKPAGLIAGATATALVVVAALAAPGGAQTQTSRTVTVQEPRPASAMDDLPPKSKSGSLSLGDRLIIGSALFDASHKRLGRFGATCTAIGSSRSFVQAPLQCFASYSLADGEILAMGAMTLSRTNLAIIGGTGAYAGVHGTVTSTVKPAKGFDDADVLTIKG